MIALLPRFFDRNRGFAMGFVLSGNGIGGLVLSPMTQALIEKIGIRWTLRVLGLMTLLMMTPVAFVMRQAPGFDGRRYQRGVTAPRSVFRKPEFYAQVFPFLNICGDVLPLTYVTFRRLELPCKQLET